MSTRTTNAKSAAVSDGRKANLARHKGVPEPTDDDWRSFFNLDTELRPAETATAGTNTLLGATNAFAGLGRLRGLLALPDEQRVQQEQADQQELIEKAWQLRREHPVFRFLSADPNFAALWNYFARLQSQAIEGPLAQPNAPFVFWRDIALCAGWAHYSKKGGQPFRKGMHAKARIAAVKHATALQQLIDNGARLENYADSQELRRLLESFRSELSNTKRKAYGGERESSREILKSFALWMCFMQIKSPAMVRHFAKLVKLPCSEKTAHRYCKDSSTRHRKLLAEAIGKDPWLRGRVNVVK